uniref:Uncharacterized protein n=1 Tax=Rhizophagus irregularis (strain DAOM 181602 / DAOM 197198 / MUCL 43194) TaxID=747089 RepID=U9UFT1_RHIID
MFVCETSFYFLSLYYIFLRNPFIRLLRIPILYVRAFDKTKLIHHPASLRSTDLFQTFFYQVVMFVFYNLTREA